MVTHSFKSSKVGASPVESQAGRVVVRSGRGAGRLKLLRPLALRDGIGEMLGRGFHEVKVWERADRPLADYIRDEHVDVVITFDPGRQSFAVAERVASSISPHSRDSSPGAVALPMRQARLL